MGLLVHGAVLHGPELTALLLPPLPRGAPPPIGPLLGLLQEGPGSIAQLREVVAHEMLADEAQLEQVGVAALLMCSSWPGCQS